jgi:ribosomal protein S18 acetylase RimI-like enzyme
LQKIKGAVVWPQFDKAFIEKEILNKEQWKITIDDQVACVWSTTFSDSQIWGERNDDPSVYIHRIAANPHFRGCNMVSEIVTWSRNYARENNKKFVRMDTVGENKGLITYYQKCGFDFLGLLPLKNTESLPAHYHNATVSLFQIMIL